MKTLNDKIKETLESRTKEQLWEDICEITREHYELLQLLPGYNPDRGDYACGFNDCLQQVRALFGFED